MYFCFLYIHGVICIIGLEKSSQVRFILGVDCNEYWDGNTFIFPQCMKTFRHVLKSVYMLICNYLLLLGCFKYISLHSANLDVCFVPLMQRSHFKRKNKKKFMVWYLVWYPLFFKFLSVKAVLKNHDLIQSNKSYKINPNQTLLDCF